MIYIASKTRHAHLWKLLRDTGWPIISTWIDESEPEQTTDFNDLWERCLEEASQCEVFIIYKEPEDILKGAWIELGAALIGKPRILAIGIQEFTIAKYSRIEHFPSIMDALLTTGYK